MLMPILFAFQIEDNNLHVKKMIPEQNKMLKEIIIDKI